MKGPGIERALPIITFKRATRALVSDSHRSGLLLVPLKTVQHKLEHHHHHKPSKDLEGRVFRANQGG